MTNNKLSLQKATIILVILLPVIIWVFSLPSQLFPGYYSTVMFDANGQLLNARVASDGQWRFAQSNRIPDNYQAALLNFEDRYFNYHPGFNPVALGRALWQNLRHKGIKSGASTISMQVIRLSRNGKPRTIVEKMVEIWLATRLEMRYSKKEILQLYASHAPMGGNVVGLQAASWRYFGHSFEELSWAEAATLAVLPNSPSLIFPGRNQQLLLQKRNQLLQVLHQRGFLDEISLQLAMAESLPGKPHPLPQNAPHLFMRSLNDGLEAQQIYTTLDAQLQKRVESVLLRHHAQLRGNHIHNIAALVADVNTGKVLAYWGNTPEHLQKVSAGKVDVIAARRSPGSLLKPFLYAGLLKEGQILPHSLVPDIPTHFQGFNPENFSRSYDGAVPAGRALARSLNIPAVRMLMDYHPDKFLSLLKSCGLQTFDKPASHYGLSMILGGGEVSMWDITGAYASMARTLGQWQYDLAEENQSTFFPLRYIEGRKSSISAPSPFSPGVIWHTFEAMVEAARPDTQANCHLFDGRRKVAWKTGTSYGNRDAWAIGVDPSYVVAVWTGNATGEGRPALTGIAASAPVLFDIFGLLPSRQWFTRPVEDLKPMKVCNISGYPASEWCTADTLWVPRLDYQTGVCPFHIPVHIEKGGNKRVNNNCMSWAKMETHSWFVLPPVQAYYYQARNPFYKPLPAFKEGCNDISETRNPMQWIYPAESSVIFIPHEMDGTPGEAIFRIAHRIETTRVHWHLDNEYAGTTTHFHEMAFRPEAGKHTLSIMDEHGNSLNKEIEIRLKSRE